MIGHRILTAVLCCLLLLATAACTVNPATGERSFTAFMSAEEEQRVGDQEHPKLVQQFGGLYDDQSLAAYVDRVGQRLARVTEIPDRRYTFVVLNDDKINAFALPGGYVHVTRGLLALADNEAEMAGVLAHELGHITARHSAQRYSQSVLAGLGAATVGVLGAAVGVPTGDLASFGAQAYVQGFSRDQELEADQLGIRYMTRAGYDPRAMESFFRKMDAYTQLQATIAGDPGAADRFSILASHPRTSDRVEQAIRAARQAPVANPIVNEDEYLGRIDGILFGDHPSQGVRRDRDFLHPGLRIAFRVPPGFVMFNQPTEVVARGPEGAMIVFDAERDRERARAFGRMTDYVATAFKGRQLTAPVQAITVDGLPAATAATRVRAQSGALVDIRLVAIRERADRIYRFIFLTPASVTNRLAENLQRTTFSFRRLSEAEAAAVKPLRVDVVTVGSGDTPANLAARMPFSDYREERFRALNGLAPGELLSAGEKVKTIVD